MPRKPQKRTIDFIILGMVNHEPMYGYEIKARIEQQISYFWSEVSYGQIYPALKRLEKKGFIAHKLQKQGNRPSRKLYHINERGTNSLKSWLEKPIDYTETSQGFSLLQQFLVKLYFSGAIPKENAIENIEELRTWLEKTIGTFHGFEANLNQHLKESPDHKYYLLTALFGKKVFEAVYEWTKDAKKIL